MYTSEHDSAHRTKAIQTFSARPEAHPTYYTFRLLIENGERRLPRHTVGLVKLLYTLHILARVEAHAEIGLRHLFIFRHFAQNYPKW